jgi:methionine--tRNA ligase beta chain
METITYDDWKKLALRTGRVLEVERVPKTAKLYRLQVDVGLERPIQIVSSLVPYYTAEDLLGRSIVVLVNLQPTKFGGQVSEGMLLCAETEDGGTCVLLGAQGDVPPGTAIT